MRSHERLTRWPTTRPPLEHHQRVGGFEPGPSGQDHERIDVELGDVPVQMHKPDATR